MKIGRPKVISDGKTLCMIISARDERILREHFPSEISTSRIVRGLMRDYIINNGLEEQDNEREETERIEVTE